MRSLHYSIGLVAVLMFGGVVSALAQVAPYNPSAGGTGSTGGTSYPTGGGSFGGSTGRGTSGGSTTPTDPDSGSGDSTGTMFDNWADDGPAVDFQDDVEEIVKKHKKYKKPFLGISVFGRPDIQRLTFTGSAIGSYWRIGGTKNDPVLQGTLTGRGSRTAVRIGLYTGSVYAQFAGAKSNWVANYYSEGAAQRSDLYNGKFGTYQEETAVDDEGYSRKLALLLNNQTLFGAYEGGAFFIVDKDAMPDVAPASWAISIPRSTGPIIPRQKIIELLTKAGIALRTMFVEVVHATIRSLTPAQVFDRLVAYKKIVKTMQDIEQQFNTFDFNDPTIDDAVEELIDAYDVEQKKLDDLVTQLGRARLFVRGGDWLMTGGSAMEQLIADGIDVVPAALISQVSGMFDFYTVQEVEGENKVFAGTCRANNNPTTGEEVVCTLRTSSALESQSIIVAHEVYLDLVAQAHQSLGDIELALFDPVQTSQ